MSDEGRKSRKSIVNVLFLAVGLALFIFLLVRLDPQTIGERLREVGWFFVPAFLCYVGNLFFATLTWHATVDPKRSNATIIELWQAFWAGHALNAVTPGGGAGEVLKASLLRGKLEGKELVASIIRYNGINLAVTAGTGVLGAAVCFLFLDIPRDATGLILGVSVVVFFLILLLFWWIHSGAVSHVVRVARRLPFIKIDQRAELIEKAQEVDQRLSDFVRTQPRRLARSISLSFCVRLLQIAETGFLLLPLMATEQVLLLAILMQVASNLIVWIAALVPARIGVMEGGNVGLFEMAGLDPVVAFTVVIAKRFRMILGVAIGLVLGSRVVGHQASQPSPKDS